jgi:UDP-N-acetylmuramate--alanine ligase
MDFFQTMDSLKTAFLAFINKVPFYGASVVCLENEHIRELLPSIHRRCITYGFAKEAVLRAENIAKGFMSVTFDAVYKERHIGQFALPLPGRHNVLNGLAAIGCAMALRMDISVVQEALKGFSGIQRRLEFKGQAGGIKVFDDYGHHPTEVRATLRAVKDGAAEPGGRGAGRLIVLFQPHRYTRTRDLIDDFAGSFGDADMLILLDIYPAGEKPIEGTTSEGLLEKIKQKGHENACLQKKEKAADYILSQAREGDFVLTLGAGDVWKAGEEILKTLKENSKR